MIEIFSGLVFVLILISLIFAAVTKKLLHSIFAVFFTLFLVAGCYVLLGSDFLAATQIMVYIGGILILVLFGLTTLKSKKEAVSLVPNHNLLNILVVLIVTFLLASSNLSIMKVKQNDIYFTDSQVRNFGIELVTNQIFGFEAIGFLLLISLIGAGFIAKKD